MKNIIFVLYALLTSLSLLAQEKEILVNIPKEVKAGNDFIMIVNIPANYFNGIARLQFTLPNGLTATARKTTNAEFSFENQKGTFHWLNFPQDQDVELSMNVSTAPTIQGYFVIKGDVSYLKGNEPEHFEIIPQIITVKPGDLTDVEMKEQLEMTKVTYEEFKSEGVACIRQVPYLENGEIIVNLLVSKGEFNKYGKIQENIPVGYQVVNVKSYNAIFVYNSKQHVVKYMWMNMPMAPKFVVTYKLIATDHVNKNDPFLIYGTFYYADNNRTLTVDIQERGIELQNH